MTSGYADYVYQPELLDGTGLDPFRQWTSEEMIGIGTSVPLYFEPAEQNWGYSHTNYVILGRALEQIAGKPMAEIMQEYIVEPMGLANTSSNENTPLIPSPCCTRSARSGTARRCRSLRPTRSTRRRRSGTHRGRLPKGPCRQRTSTT